MAGSVGEVKVLGTRELQMAFREIGRDAQKDLRKSLAEAVEPVRMKAESLAVSEIRNIGDRWSRMRIGVTTKSVYVAPKTRPSGRGSGRPNLAPLLMDRAMVPALDTEQPEILAKVDHMLDVLGEKAGF